MATNKPEYMREFMKKYYATTKGKKLVLTAMKRYAQTENGKRKRLLIKLKAKEDGTSAKYMRERRSSLKSKGLCVECGRKAKPNRCHCTKCAIKNRTRLRKHDNTETELQTE